jgi:hypothetical protein
MPLRRPAARHVERVAGWLTSIVLGRSALAHLAQPYAFLDAIGGYRIVPADLEVVVAAALPALQLTLAVALALGWWTGSAHGLAALCFLAFAAAQTSAILRGLEISCGCFGAAASVQVSGRTLGFALACAAVSLCGWIADRIGSKEASCVAPRSPSSKP